MTRRRRWLAVVLLLLGSAVVVRAMLPIWIADMLNRRMAEMGEYRGSLTEVDLSLYRGAYTVHQLVVGKRSGEVPEPLLRVPRLELSIGWRDLFRGALVGEAVFHSPEVNFVDGRREGEDQAGRGVDWREQLEELFPVRINEVRIHDGQVHFLNPWSSPPVDLQATQVEALITNLTNVRDGEGQRDASVEARANILGQAPMELRADFDPWGALDDFSFAMRIREIELPRVNEFARAYANLDLASGRGDFVMEMEAMDGQLSGYAKPLFTDLEIFDWKQDVEQDGDNPFRLLWEGVSDLVAELFENQPRDRFATRIPIEGRTDNPEIAGFDAVIGVLRNAFIEAYEARFER